MKHDIEHEDLVTILAALVLFEQMGSPKAGPVLKKLIADETLASQNLARALNNGPAAD